MTDSEETADEALLRRLREAIGPEQAANLDPGAQLEAVLRLLHEHPAASEERAGHDRPRRLATGMSASRSPDDQTLTAEHHKRRS